jgi:energy-coupling factor transporter ATP-binding protein EcfA2
MAIRGLLEEINVKLVPDFMMHICGPSGCGKSAFVKNLILSPDLWSVYPDHIFICHRSDSSQYDSISNLPVPVTLWQGTIDFDLIKNTPGYKLLYLDDLLASTIEKYKNELTEVYCVSSHHSNISICSCTHQLFLPGLRNLRLQSTYFVLFENKVASDSIARFANQTGQRSIFMDAYKKATQRNYGYLFYDAAPNTDNRHRLRGEICTVPQVVFIPE